MTAPFEHIFVVFFLSKKWPLCSRGWMNCGVTWIYAKLLDTLLFLFPSLNQTKNGWELKFNTHTGLWHIKTLFSLFSRENYFIDHYFWPTGRYGPFPWIFAITICDETWYYSQATVSNDMKSFQINLKFDSINPQKMSSNSGVISQKTFFLTSVYWLN